METTNKVDYVFESMKDTSALPVQGIFFDGQIFDAYTFVADLIRKARQRIVLIDNYIDDTVLTILSKRTDGVECVIYTGKTSKQLQLDIDKHNAQYSPIDVRTFSKAHDRFLIIDNDVYLISASIKDLGKKWLGLTLMENTNADELSDIYNDCRLSQQSRERRCAPLSLAPGAREKSQTYVLSILQAGIDRTR